MLLPGKILHRPVYGERTKSAGPCFVCLQVSIPAGWPWFLSKQRVPAGQEPFRKLGLKINEKPLTSAAECRLILDTQEVFWKMYLEVGLARKCWHVWGAERNSDGCRPDL